MNKLCMLVTLATLGLSAAPLGVNEVIVQRRVVQQG